MPLHEFNEMGDLPVGVHKATLSEVTKLFFKKEKFDQKK
jgi:hypothetical protein